MDIYELFGAEIVSRLKKSEIVILHLIVSAERNSDGMVKLSHGMALSRGIKSPVTLRTSLRRLESEGMIRNVGKETSRGMPNLYAICL